MPRPPLLSNQLRRFIKESGKTRYRLSVETEIDEASLSRFMAGKRSLSQKAWDALGRYFGLEFRESYCTPTADERLREALERSEKDFVKRSGKKPRRPSKK